MGSERMNAMEEERKNPYGKPTWLYIDQDKLERLGITSYRPLPGQCVIRIIPPIDPRTPWAKRVHLHKDIGANKKTFICLKRMFSLPCPICEYADRRKAEGAETSELVAFWPKTRDLIFIYDISNPQAEEKGLRWWDAPCDDNHAIKENIYALSKDPVTQAPIDVSDPENGRDIMFTRKGTDRSTSYFGFQLIDNNPIPAEWYADIPKFEDVLMVATYDEISKELYGTTATETADEQETAPDTQRGAATAGAPQTRNEARGATATPAVQAPAVQAPAVQAPAATQQPVTRGRRSYSNNNAASPAAPGADSKPSIDQRIADIQNRKAARVQGNGGQA